ncbi:hypothetical protein CASFOL_025372 [Castilleja foliolosa]|uniref:C2H2-type domain-containing protein n=1 Tax=Castilleja foliolosa TaxID=1961234 RepID=A0ABD3CRT6_9LAMI
MVKTGKESRPLDGPNVKYDRSFFVDRHEIVKLTKMAKAWEFTCSFCFKKFSSAQAMGGHQNAHRNERLEERKRYIRDPIGYRKRAYILAMKEAADQQSSTVDQGVGPYLHAAKYEFTSINGPPKTLHQKNLADAFEFNARNINSNNNDNYFCQPLKNKDSEPVVVMNFLPAKELSLADCVGVGGADAKGKACMEFNGDGYGIVGFDLKLDLTLKL